MARGAGPIASARSNPVTIIPKPTPPPIPPQVPPHMTTTAKAPPTLSASPTRRHRRPFTPWRCSRQFRDWMATPVGARSRLRRF